MSLSATWQRLPTHLFRPLLAGVLTLVEASELWDLALTTPAGEWAPLPPRLWPAAERLALWQAPAMPGLH